MTFALHLIRCESAPPFINALLDLICVITRFRRGGHFHTRELPLQKAVVDRRWRQLYRVFSLMF